MIRNLPQAGTIMYTANYSPIDPPVNEFTTTTVQEVFRKHFMASP